jgi:hypothetical protein
VISTELRKFSWTTRSGADERGVVDIEACYLSYGVTGERAVWFHDSVGNLIGLSELVG